MRDQESTKKHEAEQRNASQPTDSAKAALISKVGQSYVPSTDADEAIPSTHLGPMTLSMFEKGQFVRVRVGAAQNATELYEHAFASAEEANTALLEAGILTADQVPDSLKVAGTGIQLKAITAEQLEKAGLKRHLGSSL